MVDVVDPTDEFTVQQFQAAALSVLDGIADRGHRALLVGGTGLYLRSLIDDPDLSRPVPRRGCGPGGRAGRPPDDPIAPKPSRPWPGLHARLADLDPVAAARMEPTNRRRVIRALEVTMGSGRPFSSFGPGLEAYPETRFALVGLPLAADIDRRIEERFAAQMEAGFLDEVRELAACSGGLSRTARQALGYRELLSHVEDGVPLEAAWSEAVRRTRVFARPPVGLVPARSPYRVGRGTRGPGGPGQRRFCRRGLPSGGKTKSDRPSEARDHTHDDALHQAPRCRERLPGHRGHGGPAAPRAGRGAGPCVTVTSALGPTA